MFQCNTGGSKFQEWNVLYCLGTIVVTIVFCVLTIILSLVSAPVQFLVQALVTAGIQCLIQLLFAHLGWFFVVKEQGCCGHVGYLIWGIIYIVLCLFGFVRVNVFSLADILWVLLLVPAVYMAIACFQLFGQGISVKTTTTTVNAPGPSMYPPA